MLLIKKNTKTYIPTIPNSFPIPKVTAIAMTPPSTTRIIATRLREPPAFALNAPVIISAIITIIKSIKKVQHLII